jgi:hypothetical protein
VLIPLLASTRPLPQDRILRVEGSITSDTPEADPPDNKAASSTRLR